MANDIAASRGTGTWRIMLYKPEQKFQVTGTLLLTSQHLTILDSSNIKICLFIAPFQNVAYIQLMEE